VGIVAWIVFGLIAGAVAKMIAPGKDPGGWLITLAIGIAGAVVGGFLASLLGFGGVSGFNLGSLLVAIVGALVVLFIWRKVGGR
jgi:uncharacterized membrane protein YeaQ/YmgE (transglycosylase-associated protein family)